MFLFKTSNIYGEGVCMCVYVHEPMCEWVLGVRNANKFKSIHYSATQKKKKPINILNLFHVVFFYDILIVW